MSVHDGAKKILRHLLDLAIEHGNLNMQTALQYDELAKVARSVNVLHGVVDLRRRRV